MKPVSIVMPAYNEGGHIYENIRTTVKILGDAGICAEVVAVDDGSEDDTLAEIERAARDFDDIVVARNPYNMGKGMALRTGFDYSSGEIVVFLDADLDLHPSQIQKVIGVLEEGPYDVVVTSKHHPESRIDYPWFRKAASWAYYMLIKVMFGLPVRDTQTGLKVFRRKVLLDVFHRLLVKKFAYDVELLATAVRFGYRVREVPVALEFKRELTWGRIRLEDVFRIFIDTFAIFYRLRILRYYDGERPQRPKKEKRVLVVVYGCPPPADVIKRLSVDSNVRLACIAENAAAGTDDVIYFGTAEQFGAWLKGQTDNYEVVGFLGAGYLPNGSWVKNALRNFETPGVEAVCGPLIPGPFSTLMGKAAGLTSSSVLTTGPRYYLHSFRTARFVKRCSLDNVFLESDYWKREENESEGLSIRDGLVVDTSAGGNRLRYDPDVAVSKPVPPLFLPYLRTAAGDAFRRGAEFARGRGDPSHLWNLALTLAWVFLAAGWVVLPAGLQCFVAALYCTVVLLAGFSCFDFLAAPLFAAGIFLEHLVRACAFPAGMVSGLLGTRGERRV